MNDLYDNAIAYWGIDAQAANTMVECSQLIAQLSIYFVQKIQNRDAVIRELADVEIMIEQMKVIFGSDNVAAEKKIRLERIRQIIDGDLAHPHTLTDGKKL